MTNVFVVREPTKRGKAVVHFAELKDAERFAAEHSKAKKKLWVDTCFVFPSYEMTLTKDYDLLSGRVKR